MKTAKRFLVITVALYSLAGCNNTSTTSESKDTSMQITAVDSNQVDKFMSLNLKRREFVIEVTRASRRHVGSKLAFSNI